MAQYYIGKNNQQLGPFEVNQLLANGLTPDTLVWCNGMSGWEMARNVPELAGLFGAQQQPQQFGGYQQQPQQPYQQPYQQPQQQPYQQPQYQQQYGYQQASAYQQPTQPMPDNNLVWAILSTVFCCLPLGIVAIIKATSVKDLYLRGDYNGAVDAANQAKKWAMWGAILSLIGALLYILFVVVLGVAAGMH